MRLHRRPQLRTACFACLAGLATAASTAHAQYAVEVVSYDQGTTAAEIFGTDPPEYFNQTSAALSSPERFTGEGSFPSAVTPFNPPFLPSEVTSIGEGGQLTLRLSNFAIPQSAAPEIGVFTNAGLADQDYPNGLAANPIGPSGTTFGIDNAVVEVSEDGMAWESLGEVTFDIPTAGYTDANNSIESDFQQPFTGALNDFAGLSFDAPASPDILELLAGSGGGGWLDLSGTSLSQVGFLRFSVADDSNASTSLNFELDAVSIAHDALGAATIPEPASFWLFAASCCALLAKRAPRRKL